MPLVVELPPKTFAGVVPEDYARNGLPANGVWERNAIARQLNHLLSYHGQIIPGKSIAPSLARDSLTDDRLWTVYYPATPNGTTLVSTVRCIPTNTDVGEPRWYLKVDGDIQDSQVHNVRCVSGAGETYDDAFEMTQEITVTAGVSHQIDLHTVAHCRVIEWSLCEKPRSSISVGVDRVVDYTYALPFSPVRNATIASIRQAADLVWNRHRGCPVIYHVDDPDSPIVVTSTTPATVIAGLVIPTEFRNSYADHNLLNGRSNEAIPCVAWALAERVSGANKGLLRFIGGNHAGGVDVEIDGSLGIYTSTAFTLLPQSGGDQVSVQYLINTGSSTVNIYDFGLFPLVGT